jgi:uncharacterized membrane protein YdjX (TVP38/TMEM64 family)
MTTPPEPSEPAPTPRWVRLTLAVALLGLLAGLYASGLHRFLDWDTLRSHVAAWRAQAQDNRLAALAVFFAAYVVLTTLSLPVAAALSILSGALFDRWTGTCATSLSATAGATLAFLCGRYLFRDWVRRRLGRRMAAIDRGVRRDGAFYLFSLRLSPVPFFLVNLGMALTPMRLGTFAFVTWLGMLLPCFLYANAGSHLRQIERPADALSVPVLGSLALLGLVPLAVRLLLVRLRRV